MKFIHSSLSLAVLLCASVDLCLAQTLINGTIPAAVISGPGWYRTPFFSGSARCVVGVGSAAATTTNLTMALVEQSDFNWWLNGTGRGYHPVDSLICTGPHISSCLIATGDLQSGNNYTILFTNSQAYSINFSYLWASGCTNDSSLAQGGGFAGSFITNTGGQGGNYSFGQTVNIASQCLTFYATAPTKFRAWVYKTADAEAFLRNPTSISPIPGGFCDFTNRCNITLTNLTASANYTIFYQPNNTDAGTSQFVAYSLLPSCYPASFIIPPNRLVPLGPFTNVTSINYTLIPNLYILTAVLASDGSPTSSSSGAINNKVFSISPGSVSTIVASDLTPNTKYWIAIQHNDISQDSALVYFVRNPGTSNQSLLSGRRLMQQGDLWESQSQLGHQHWSRMLLDASSAGIVAAPVPGPSAQPSTGSSILKSTGLSSQSFNYLTGLSSSSYSQYAQSQSTSAVMNACINGSATTSC